MLEESLSHQYSIVNLKYEFILWILRSWVGHDKFQEKTAIDHLYNIIKIFPVYYKSVFISLQ